ncbi:MAG: hypothetical protein CME71_10695 [Halobacteriovorax sp.]|nr:hypothetical protein [Halobacteriovorax sp.]
MLRHLLPFIAPYRARVIGSILFSFVLAAIGAAQVGLVQPLFDKGLSPESTREEVIILASKLLALGILNFPARFFHFFWIRTAMEEATCALRTSVFSKMQRLPSSFYTRSKQGQMISHILNDTRIQAEALKAFVDLIREPLKAIAYLSMAFWADWQLTLVIFVIAPFLAAIFQVSGKKVHRNQADVQREQGEFTHAVAEGISAHKITKAFNLQRFVTNRFDHYQSRFFQAQKKTMFVEEFAHPLVEVIGAIAFSAVIVFAHHRIQSGVTSIGDFVSFIAALALFMDPIRKFSQANVKLSQAKAAHERVMELMLLDEEPDTGNYHPTEFKRSIEVKDLTFTYGEGEVLKNFSMHVKKGEKVGLVGLSGSGKSTLINLLLGLYPVKHGSILLDEKAIADIKLNNLRGLFGLVSQDIFLFNDTIKGNLTLGKEFSDEQIKHALDVSYASEFVDKLPDGLETIVGDRGTRLSGGQQQRLTIARAFLQDTEILLFDEATSALDNESEKVVQKALESIASQKTVVAVAHRLSTIQDYDRIYVLSQGELVEQGNHQELMAKGGEYAKLYDLSVKS